MGVGAGDGDLVVWLDPKAGRLSTRLVPMLTAPLLTDPDVRLVKPFRTQAPDDSGGAGRPRAPALPAWPPTIC